MSVRKGSSWRSRMFRTVWLIQRGKCEHCGGEERFFWRNGGLTGGVPDGTLHTVVWLTSNLELDHIIPLHLGGSNDCENLQLLCTDCHKTKTIRERQGRAAAVRAFA